MDGHFEQGDLDLISLTGTETPDVRAEDGLRTDVRGGRVDDLEADLLGLPVRLAGHPHDAALGLCRYVQTRSQPRRAVQPETADSGVYDLRLLGANGPRPQSEGLHHTGAKVLDDDVGAGDQLPCDPPAARILQIQRDTSLVPAVGVEHGPAGNTDHPGRFAVDRLDLDDIGSHVTEKLSGGGRRDELAEVDDSDTFQGLGHRGPS